MSDRDHPTLVWCVRSQKKFCNHNKTVTHMPYEYNLVNSLIFIFFWKISDNIAKTVRDSLIVSVKFE